MYLSAIEKLYGKDTGLEANEGFMNTASYINNMTGPTGIPFNYSDCGGSGGVQAAAFWFASRTGDPSMVWSQKYFLTTKKPSNDRLLPAILIWSAGITLDEINPPSELVWAGQGKNAVALMRTSWTDQEGVFVGFKAGSPSVNHGHMDVGSFVMDALGQRWAMDFGMQDYNSLETAGVNLWSMAQNSQRWEVFRYNNYVHNTLTVNDQIQVVGGKSSIKSHSSKAGMMNAIADISEVYKPLLNKAVRGVAIVDNKYVMVRDEIEAPSSATKVRWTLLTPATVNITGKNTAELTRNGKKLILKVVSPSELTMKTWSTVPPHSYDAPNPGTSLTGFETDLQPGTPAVLTILLIPEGAAENTSATTLKLSEWPADKK
jgi:hypothetical protein